MKIKNLLYNVLMALLIGFAANLVFGVNTYAVAGVTFAAGAFMPSTKAMKTGFFMMAVQKEIWQDHIEGEIFKDNAFLQKAYQVGKEFINGKAVHIPQSGGSGAVVKNRTTFPATVTEVTDTDVIYLIDSYTTSPVKIPNVDNYQLSYDKRGKVLGEDRDKLTQVVAEWMLMNWINTPAYGTYNATSIPLATRQLLTTGDGAAASAPSATGLRRKAALGDLQRMATKFKTENRWFEGKMHALLTPAMEADLFPAESVLTATYMQSVTEQERREGVVFKVQGWKIMTRSSVYTLSAADAFKAPGAAGAATDDEGSLFWYENAVEFAMGDMDFFESLKNPEYYADIFSMEIFTGGRARRNDYLGVALLRQAKTT